MCLLTFHESVPLLKPSTEPLPDTKKGKKRGEGSYFAIVRREKKGVKRSSLSCAERRGGGGRSAPTHFRAQKERDGAIAARRHDAIVRSPTEDERYPSEDAIVRRTVRGRERERDKTKGSETIVRSKSDLEDERYRKSDREDYIYGDLQQRGYRAQEVRSRRLSCALSSSNNISERSEDRDGRRSGGGRAVLDGKDIGLVGYRELSGS